jgi:polyisoprenoid-binding protein YceI
VRTATRTRRHHRVDLPVPGTWEIDPERSEVAFIARHFLPGNLFGPFSEDIRIRVRGVHGTIEIADHLVSSTVEMLLDLRTITTGDRRRDALLQGPDGFDVDRYPTSMFRGAVVRGRRSSGHVAGTFTFLGEPRDVSLDTAHHRFAWDPTREAAGTFLSVGVVDRAAWGLRPGPAHPAGALLLARDVRIELQLGATLQG